MAQTEMVAAELQAFCPDLQMEFVSMTTEGDRRLDRKLADFGGKGVFIKELEIALLEGRADIAVHSLKDMPAEVLPEFKLAAVLRREDPRDVFVAKAGSSLKFMDLPAGSRVGTGSVRRVVQLKAIRPDLEYVPIRGNLQTRLKKLDEDGEQGLPLAGIILAAAGLRRLGLENRISEYFPTDQMLPASGQGIIAIEILKSAKPSLSEMLSRVNDAKAYASAVAEMAFLKALEAGCQFPVAAFAEFKSSASGETSPSNNDCQELQIRGIYWDEATSRLLRVEANSRIDLSASTESIKESCRSLGFELAQKINAARL